MGQQSVIERLQSEYSAKLRQAWREGDQLHRRLRAIAILSEAMREHPGGFIDAVQVPFILNVSRQRVRAMLVSGRVPSFMLFGRRQVPIAALMTAPTLRDGGSAIPHDNAGFRDGVPMPNLYGRGVNDSQDEVLSKNNTKISVRADVS